MDCPRTLRIGSCTFPEIDITPTLGISLIVAVFALGCGGGAGDWRSHAPNSETEGPLEKIVWFSSG
ncbi:MAG: hypothetical protein QOH67_4957 [Hyphomicrobiales bacterium]|nr:hypothetical protein [Hyphomicrobiales bacterium]